MLRCFCCILIFVLCGMPSYAAPPSFLQTLPALTANDIAVIVNDSDPLSVRIAAYYQQKRAIPAANIIHIRFNPQVAVLARSEFAELKTRVEQQTPKPVQAFVLTWLLPFRVECMSITTAFAMGFDPAFCADGCQPTRSNPYFGSFSSKPYTDFNIRPTMTLAAKTFAEAKDLIDRGVSADYSHPQGSAYLLKTSDVARSSRAVGFAQIAQKFEGIWPVNYIEADSIRDKHDVLFYFTGMAQVADLRTNRFLPGAIADHLTSSGGVLSGSEQMSLLAWLEAGATASYGAVIEPCNFPAKFPHPEIVLHFYLRGASLLEAYWKSVAQPGQGIFVGEPLAKPFAYRALKP